MNTLTTIDELAFAPGLQHDTLEDTTSDHALLEATRSGDQDAFAELVNRYRNQITSYIYRMTNDYDGAVDLAQRTVVSQPCSSNLGHGQACSSPHTVPKGSRIRQMRRPWSRVRGPRCSTQPALASARQVSSKVLDVEVHDRTALRIAFAIGRMEVQLDVLDIDKRNVVAHLGAERVAPIGRQQRLARPRRP